MAKSRLRALEEKLGQQLDVSPPRYKHVL
uniref:Uncharacterized protein n=1 Tax=Arundo donax TaxID=35708 RepID=A0A0A8YAZ5_ARUDO